MSRAVVTFYRNAHWWFLLALAVTVIGFFHSFFSRFTKTDLRHHFHGITATLWMILLIVQPYLYRKGNMALHRRLGKVTFALAPLLVVGGLLMVHTMLNNKEAYPPLTVYQLSFLDFFFIAQFIWFYNMAIKYHRETALHARYIAGTVLLLLPPGLVRALFLIPAVTSFDISLNITYLLVELTTLLLLLDDKRKGGIRPPYVIAMCCFLLQHIGVQFMASVPFWQKLMDAYASL